MNIILKVVDKFLIQLRKPACTIKKLMLLLQQNLKTFLAKTGFDPQMGARPMERLIQDTIRKALG